MKISQKIACLLLLICPLLRADDTDTGKFGHIISNRSSHKVHVHLDIANKSDKAIWLKPGEVWKTGEAGKINAFEIRDDETGILFKTVVPKEDGGKYKVLWINPGPNNGKNIGAKYSSVKDAGSRYKLQLFYVDDRY